MGKNHWPETIEAMVDRLGYSELRSLERSASPSGVKRARKVLAALGQMAESEDYSPYATSDRYNYFDEVLKKPQVRTWLAWSEEARRFTDDERLDQFYSWITPDDDLNGNTRIPIAESIRDLGPVLGEPEALEILNTPG